MALCGFLLFSAWFRSANSYIEEKTAITSNVQDVLADPRWKKAMNEEMESFFRSV